MNWLSYRNISTSVVMALAFTYPLLPPTIATTLAIFLSSVYIEGEVGGSFHMWLYFIVGLVCGKVKRLRDTGFPC